MITLFLSFFMSLVNPAPIGRDPAPVVTPPPVVMEQEIASSSLLVRPLQTAHDYDAITELRFVEGSAVGGAGDGWDRVRQLLRDHAPDCPADQDAADRQP